IRLGTSYTRSREDRFSNLDQRNPENTSLYNSDGVLTFATGAFAPNVTLQEATYRMWAVDAAVKWRGLGFKWATLCSLARLIRSRPPATPTLHIPSWLRNVAERFCRSEEVGIVWPHVVRFRPVRQFP